VATGACCEEGGRIVARLAEILGSTLIAVMVGVGHASTLREWIGGGSPVDRLSGFAA
jgi:hypothetical protein